MTEDVIQFPQKPVPSDPNKCAPGQPGTLVTVDGDVLCIGELPAGIDMPSPEFAQLDIDALFNLRSWVEEAVIAKGGEIVGAGIGCGGKLGIADLQVRLEGHEFNLEIRPLT